MLGCLAKNGDEPLTSTLVQWRRGPSNSASGVPLRSAMKGDAHPSHSISSCLSEFCCTAGRLGLAPPCGAAAPRKTLAPGSQTRPRQGQAARSCARRRLQSSPRGRRDLRRMTHSAGYWHVAANRRRSCHKSPGALCPLKVQRPRIPLATAYQQVERPSRLGVVPQQLRLPAKKSRTQTISPVHRTICPTSGTLPPLASHVNSRRRSREGNRRNTGKQVDPGGPARRDPLSGRQQSSGYASTSGVSPIHTSSSCGHRANLQCATLSPTHSTTYRSPGKRLDNQSTSTAGGPAMASSALHSTGYELSQQNCQNDPAGARSGEHVSHSTEFEDSNRIPGQRSATASKVSTQAVIASLGRVSSTSRPLCEIKERNKRVTSTPTNFHAGVEPNWEHWVNMTCLNLDRMTFRTLGREVTLSHQHEWLDADIHGHLSLSVHAQPRFQTCPSWSKWRNDFQTVFPLCTNVLFSG